MRSFTFGTNIGVTTYNRYLRIYNSNIFFCHFLSIGIMQINFMQIKPKTRHKNIRLEY